MDASVIQSAIELFLQNADWIGISGLLGLILPVLIELFTKKITGKWKIVIVYVTGLKLCAEAADLTLVKW